ncbi:MAG: hypothetical protein LBP83_01365 [Dysgonamonadaceae bacterium]|nr:hypothetical protein [Dysgonamonadaceae bacterium]
MFFSCKAVAQVTIGMIEEPNRAALLDLKTQAPSTPDGPTTDLGGGGLQLPRVFLVDRKTLEPFIPTTDPDWGEDLKKKHTGLEVYNLSITNGLKAGVYYWDGSQWQSAEDRNWTIGGNSMNATKPVLGTLSNDSLSLVTNGNEKMVLGKQDGEIYLKNLPPAPEAGTVPVQINEKGQLFAVVDEANDYDTKPFTYIKFTIYTDTDKGFPGHFDWVNDFNTKISSDKFVMTIIGSAFQQDDSTSTGALMKGSETDTFGTTQIYAFENAGTWHIRADYAQASPAKSTIGYKWLIYTLIVNKSMISSEYDIRGRMGNGEIDGSAGDGVDAMYDTPSNLQ